MLSYARVFTAPIILAAVFVALSANVSAQQPQVTASSFAEFGVFPGAVITSPIGDLMSIRGIVPCSDQYGSATSVNLSLGLWGAFVFNPGAQLDGGLTLRSIRLTAAYDDLTTEFESEVRGFDAYDDFNGRYTTLETEFGADFDLRYISGAVELEAAMGPNLLMRIGPSIGLPLSGSSSQRESIVSPSNASFSNDMQERPIPEGNGDLSDLGIRIGVSAGVSYRLPIGRRLFFEPSAGIDYGFTTIQPDWSLLIGRVGICIGYSLIPEPVTIVANEPVAEPTPPTVPPFDAKLDVQVTADRLPIELRRQIVARYVPIVPVVFFELNSSEIASRYVQIPSRSSFSESRLSPNAEASHHEILNLIGNRLANNPKASIVLTGTTSEEEASRPALARARAERVADYLKSVWGIAAGRIAVRSRLDPLVPSNPEYAEGRAENRRVELELSDQSLYAPVQLRTVEPVTEPEEIRFRTSTTSSLPIARWNLQVVSNQGTIVRVEGTGTPAPEIPWRLTQQQREQMLSGAEVEYRLEASDERGRSAMSTTRRLPLRLDTTVTVTSSADKPDNTAEFVLITFDFDQAKLTARGREELKAIVGRIGPFSKVTVVGYTDRLGDLTHNRQLAQERAKRVAESLPAGTNVSYRGAEPEEAPYSSSSAEGRFLSRTVRVTIASPK